MNNSLRCGLVALFVLIGCGGGDDSQIGSVSAPPMGESGAAGSSTVPQAGSAGAPAQAGSAGSMAAGSSGAAGGPIQDGCNSDKDCEKFNNGCTVYACNEFADMCFVKSTSCGNAGAAGSTAQAGAAGSSGASGSAPQAGAAGAAGVGGSAGAAGSAGIGGAAGAAGQTGPYLTVSLGSNPVSGTIVKKQQNIPVAGITLVGGKNKVTVPSITLTGQAKLVGQNCDFGAPCAREAVSQRITSLAIFDGDKQVGLAKAPDTKTGKATIDEMNLSIPAGEIKKLMVKASFASTASKVAPFDKVAVGIDQPWEVMVLTESGDSMLADVQWNIREQLMEKPQVVQTIINSGTLTIQADGHPPSAIVIGGKDYWVPFASYKATAQYESAAIDRASVTNGLSADLLPHSYAADFVSVAVAVDGKIIGQDILPAGNVVHKDIDLSQNPIIVPKDGSVKFQLWGKLAAPVPMSIAPEPGSVAHSGDIPSLNLSAGLTTGEWWADFGGENPSLNLRTTGASSGERMYSPKLNTLSNPMVLRKAMPVVTKQSLSSTVLYNGDLDLYKLQVAADGMIGLLQFPQFRITKTPGLKLENFRLRRGAVDLDPSMYGITLFDPIPGTPDQDVKDGMVSSSKDDNTEIFVVVTFKELEYISGSGQVYTLHATASGAHAGSSLVTSLDPDGNELKWNGTGFLSMGFGYMPAHPAYWLNGDTHQPNAYLTGEFIWNDLTELITVAKLKDEGGSYGWTNGILVHDYSQSQTLSL